RADRENGTERTPDPSVRTADVHELQRRSGPWCGRFLPVAAAVDGTAGGGGRCGSPAGRASDAYGRQQRRASRAPIERAGYGDEEFRPAADRDRAAGGTAGDYGLRFGPIQFDRNGAGG